MQYEHKKKMHRPRGRMCLRCARAAYNCSALDFAHMPAIGKDSDGVVIVKCSEYKLLEIYRHPVSAA